MTIFPEHFKAALQAPRILAKASNVFLASTMVLGNQWDILMFSVKDQK